MIFTDFNALKAKQLNIFLNENFQMFSQKHFLKLNPVHVSVRRFLQKNENRPEKTELTGFLKNTFENRNYVKKRHNTLLTLTQDIKRKVF